MSLKNKTILGLFWTSIDSVGLNIVRLIITIILARLLEPSDFGLIASIAIFIAISETMVHGGFVQALIRKVEVFDTDYSTVFVFNIVLATLFYFLIYFLSPFIAAFFDQPILVPVTKVIALVIIFHAGGIVQNISLRRALNFKTLAIINISSTLLSGGLGIAMAYQGLGVWSLVAQTTLKAFLSTLLLWLQGNWKLSLAFSRKSFRENFNFGYKISVASIVNKLGTHAYNIIIGRLYNMESLGFFYQAKKLNQTIQGSIAQVFQQVSFPVLSSIQEDRNRLINIYISFIRTTAFISFPLMMLFIVIAPAMFDVLFTDKWAESVPLFQLLCISAVFVPLIYVSGNIPVVKGRSDLFLKLEIIYKIQLFVSLAVTATIGVQAMVIGIVIQVVIQFLINIVIAGRLLNITLFYQLNRIVPMFLLSFLIMMFTTLFDFLFISSIYLLLLQVAIYIGLYISINYILNSNEQKEIIKIISGKLKRI